MRRSLSFALVGLVVRSVVYPSDIPAARLSFTSRDAVFCRSQAIVPHLTSAFTVEPDRSHLFQAEPVAKSRTRLGIHGIHSLRTARLWIGKSEPADERRPKILTKSDIQEIFKALFASERLHSAAYRKEITTWLRSTDTSDVVFRCVRQMITAPKTLLSTLLQSHVREADDVHRAGILAVGRVSLITGRILDERRPAPQTPSESAYAQALTPLIELAIESLRAPGLQSTLFFGTLAKAVFLIARSNWMSGTRLPLTLTAHLWNTVLPIATNPQLDPLTRQGAIHALSHAPASDELIHSLSQITDPRLQIAGELRKTIAALTTRKTTANRLAQVSA